MIRNRNDPAGRGRDCDVYSRGCLFEMEDRMTPIRYKRVRFENISQAVRHVSVTHDSKVNSLLGQRCFVL